MRDKANFEKADKYWRKQDGDNQDGGRRPRRFRDFKI